MVDSVRRSAARWHVDVLDRHRDVRGAGDRGSDWNGALRLLRARSSDDFLDGGNLRSSSYRQR